MSVTEDLLRNNESYAKSFTKGSLALPPAKGVAVLACMDARLDVHKIPFIPNRKNIRGFVYDVKSGRLNEVRAAAVVR